MKLNIDRVGQVTLVLVAFASLSFQEVVAETPPRLVSETDLFESEVARKMEPLERKYLGALEELQRGYSKSGALDEAVIIKEEIDRVTSGGNQAEDAVKSTEELTKLKENYHKAIERTTKPVITRYKESLGRLQTDLTAENELESAVMIRDRLAELETLSVIEIVKVATSGGSFKETASLQDWLQTKEFHWRGNSGDAVIRFEGNDAHVFANGTKIMEKRIDIKGENVFTFDWSANDTNTFTVDDNRRAFTRHMARTDSAMQGFIRNR